MEIGAEAALFPEKEYISRIFVAVCVMESPPPTQPAYLSGQVRELTQGAPLYPSPITADFQRLWRIFMTASRQRSKVEKLILDS